MKGLPKAVKIKVGDLVNFYSSVVNFQRDYSHRNPGIVMDACLIGSERNKPVATVMWSDGSFTREYTHFLKQVE